MNWKLRFQNKVTLTAILLLGLSLIYKVCELAGVMPGITQTEIANVIEMVVDLLVLLGVVTDPTTKGVTDSARAMTYTEPN
jgi:phi LC3 family holin